MTCPLYPYSVEVLLEALHLSKRVHVEAFDSCDAAAMAAKIVTQGHDPAFRGIVQTFVTELSPQAQLIRVEIRDKIEYNPLDQD